MQSSTSHQLIIKDARDLTSIANDSIHLIVTSPPYPMIQMWDEIYSEQDEHIQQALLSGEGKRAFELMHRVLDEVWVEVDRILVPGGICCINIGDATRSFDGQFAQYPNHQRVQQTFLTLDYHCLPSTIWRKVTNAPNKFLGSGMMPPNAYVTLEHEWILIFRKNGRRKFETEFEKSNRLASAYFWEERNIWFSDLWQLKGTAQKTHFAKTQRSRSGAFPFEIPYRLINMYSVKGDTVLDPFLGTGTTVFAAIASERNSIGVEIDARLQKLILAQVSTELALALNRYTSQRLEQHKQFVQAVDTPPKYYNANHDFEVVTRQERLLSLRFIESLQTHDAVLRVDYSVEEPIIPRVS